MIPRALFRRGSRGHARAGTRRADALRGWPPRGGEKPRMTAGDGGD
jgi:hypothetical protein